VAQVVKPWVQTPVPHYTCIHIHICTYIYTHTYTHALHIYKF
jgi:hypothetical protein